jgi:hypothetical protein
MSPPPESAATAAERAHLRSLVAPLRGAFRASLDARTPFADLVRSAAITPDEAEVLALLAAVELDERRQRLAVYLQDSIHLPRITLATLGRAFDPPHPGPRAVSEGSRLRSACLVDIEGTGPWATRMVSAAARVAWALVGDDAGDPDLPLGTERLIVGNEPGTSDLVLVTGPDRATRLGAAAERCAGAAFLVSSVPELAAGWDALVREATVMGAGVILEVGGELSPDARDRIERADHLAWAVSSPTELAVESVPRRPWLELRIEDGAATEDDWHRMLGAGPSRRLGREQLRLVGLAAAALDGDTDAAVRRLASGHLDAMATRVRPTRAWPDLVVPDDQREQLQELVARYRHGTLVHRDWGFPAFPSPGLVALFSGASGTGKTLAAEVVAGELGLDLYKVDLSSVVSKYIGETEKNLERIFSGAAAGELVLFFDEADALFGRRSEVADAHDRYANIEVAYLLQRLEVYDGIAIMATNLQRNMDQAFLRRIHVAVEFPLPDEDGRRAIWRLSFPDHAPTDGLDLDFLARQFRIPGGSIRNAALTAAFIAAESGGPITMEAAVLGVKREFQKLGRLRTEVEFDRYFDLVREEIDAAPVG